MKSTQNKINLDNLFIFNETRNPVRYCAPDGSKIFLTSQHTKQGSIAIASFAGQNASIPVYHTKDAQVPIDEQWYYPNHSQANPFYIWFGADRNNNDKSYNDPLDGEIYLITPGTKFEIPLGREFQIYNPYTTPAKVLMVDYPFWPQDERGATQCKNDVNSPWKSKENKEMEKFDSSISDRMLDLTLDCVVARMCIQKGNVTADDYIKAIISKLGQNIDDFKLAGTTWQDYSERKGSHPAIYEVGINNETIYDRSAEVIDKNDVITLKPIAADRKISPLSKEDAAKIRTYANQGLHNLAREVTEQQISNCFAASGSHCSGLLERSYKS